LPDYQLVHLKLWQRIYRVANLAKECFNLNRTFIFRQAQKVGNPCSLLPHYQPVKNSAALISATHSAFSATHSFLIAAAINTRYYWVTKQIP
jgi:hypothetical protein